MKALSARICIVSSSATLVNNEETSKETSISPLLIVSPWTSLTNSKVSVIVYWLLERGLSLSSHFAREKLYVLVADKIGRMASSCLCVLGNL